MVRSLADRTFQLSFRRAPRGGAALDGRGGPRRVEEQREERRGREAGLGRHRAADLENQLDKLALLFAVQ